MRKKFTKFAIVVLGVALYIITSRRISLDRQERDAMITDIISQTATSETFLTTGYNLLSSGEYGFVTDEDFGLYYPNLVGKKIYLVATVQGVHNDYISCNVYGSFFNVIFNTKIDYSEYQDYLYNQDVVILGTVADMKKLGLGFQTIQLNDCYVASIGSEAVGYELLASDIRFSDVLTVSKDVVDNSDMYNVTVSDYIDYADAISWNDIIDDTKEYKGDMVRIDGTVTSASEGFVHTTTFYVEDCDGNLWFCTYVYGKGDIILKDGMQVTVYGDVLGLSTSAVNVFMGVPKLPNINVVTYEVH